MRTPRRKAKRTTEKTVSGRFWAKVKAVKSGCLEWQGALNNAGYGRMGIAGKMKSAHRLAYEMSKGEIGEGLLVCHTCDNPKCVNIDHLFLGTPRDNMADMFQKGRSASQLKTHCPHGHEYTPENTITSKSFRYCRTCRKHRGLIGYYLKKAANASQPDITFAKEVNNNNNNKDSTQMKKPRIRELMPDGYLAKIAEETGLTNPGNISQLVRLEQTSSKHWPAVERVAQEHNPQGFEQWKSGSGAIGPR